MAAEMSRDGQTSSKSGMEFGVSLPSPICRATGDGATMTALPGAHTVVGKGHV